MRAFVVSTCLYLLVPWLVPLDVRLAGTITRPGYQVTSFSMMRNENDARSYLCAFWGNGETWSLVVYDSSSRQVFEKGDLKGWQFDSRVIHLGDRLIFLSGETLYTFRITDRTIRSYVLRRNDYSSIKVGKQQDREILIASHVNSVDLYKMSDGMFLGEVRRRVAYKYDKPDMRDDLLLYLDAPNELVAYSVDEKQVKWRFTAPQRSITMLGIKVGTATPSISYTAADDRFGPCVLLNATSGDLLRLRLSDGSVLEKKDQFRGTENNAGLLSSPSYLDINGDGILDILSGSVDHRIYCVDGKDYSVLWEYDTGNEVQMPLSFYDVNGDGVPDVFGVNDYDSKLSILDGKSGRPIEELRLKEDRKFHQTKVVLADFKGDGILDLLVRSNDRTIAIYELPSVKVRRGRIMWQPE